MSSELRRNKLSLCIMKTPSLSIQFRSAKHGRFGSFWYSGHDGDEYPDWEWEKRCVQTGFGTECVYIVDARAPYVMWINQLRATTFYYILYSKHERKFQPPAERLLYGKSRSFVRVCSPFSSVACFHENSYTHTHKVHAYTHTHDQSRRV